MKQMCPRWPSSIISLVVFIHHQRDTLTPQSAPLVPLRWTGIGRSYVAELPKRRGAFTCEAHICLIFFRSVVFNQWSLRGVPGGPQLNYGELVTK